MNFCNGFVNTMVRLLTKFSGSGDHQYIHRNIGSVTLADNSKIKRDLGMTFRDLAQSIREAVDDMIMWGHLAKPE